MKFFVSLYLNNSIFYNIFHKSLPGRCLWWLVNFHRQWSLCTTKYCSEYCCKILFYKIFSVIFSVSLESPFSLPGLISWSIWNFLWITIRSFIRKPIHRQPSKPCLAFAHEDFRIIAATTVEFSWKNCFRFSIKNL